MKLAPLVPDRAMLLFDKLQAVRASSVTNEQLKRQDFARTFYASVYDSGFDKLRLISKKAWVKRAKSGKAQCYDHINRPQLVGEWLYDHPEAMANFYDFLTIYRKCRFVIEVTSKENIALKVPDHTPYSYKEASIDLLRIGDTFRWVKQRDVTPTDNDLTPYFVNM